MKASRKQRNSAGFSLAETLMAVLILLMVSAVVAAGMPMAREAYEKAVDAANAQTLLSTTAAMLRSELSEANCEGEVAPGASITYCSGRTGLITTLSTPPADAEASVGGVPAGELPDGLRLRYEDGTRLYLVTTQTATVRLKTAFTSIGYEDGVFTISGLCVTRKGVTVASLETLKIATVNP